MTKTLQERIDAALADGFEIVQEGRVLKPQEFERIRNPSFQERVEGFDHHLLGAYGPPDYRSQFDNRLLDDEERWVHLRRPRR